MNDNKSAYNSNVYDKNIVSTLPYYREYHNQIIDLMRAMELRDIDWLDTGCGTGTSRSRIPFGGCLVDFLSAGRFLGR